MRTLLNGMYHNLSFKTYEDDAFTVLREVYLYSKWDLYVSDGEGSQISKAIQVAVLHLNLMFYQQTLKQKYSLSKMAHISTFIL